jgi:hypothetical protein
LDSVQGEAAVSSNQPLSVAQEILFRVVDAVRGTRPLPFVKLEQGIEPDSKSYLVYLTVAQIEAAQARISTSKQRPSR